MLFNYFMVWWGFFFPNMHYCKYTCLLSTNLPIDELFIFVVKWSLHFFLQVV